MKVELFPVSSKKDRKAFIDFPHDLYKDDQYYVPELYLAQSEIHNPEKNPFFKHSEVQSYLAKRDGKIVGRISAIINGNYNTYHECNIGFFGFFDVINDFEVTTKLLDAAVSWCKTKGVDRILGPTSFSLTTDTGGLLVDGFDSSPVVMMTYNKAYYADLLEQYGFTKEMDLYAYMIYTEKASEKSIRLASMLEERLSRSGIIIREVNMKDFKNEIKLIKKIYDQAWEKNWGFVPPSNEEFQHLAEGLKMIIDPEWSYIALDNGEPIGFSLSLPDINQITKSFKKGRLLPFNIFKLLMNKKKAKRVRIATLGVIESYRMKGIEAIFFAKNILLARKYNLIGGEASWILENNQMMVQAAEKLNGERYKTYRIYQFPLN